MVRRSGVLALVLFVFSASAALACNEPSLGLISGSARAGDPVSFSAAHLDAGATYTILLGGSVVSSGTAGGSGTIAGSFAMPALGRAGTYYVELHVAHDGGTWVSSLPIGLVAPAPTSSPARASQTRVASTPETRARPPASVPAQQPTAAPATKAQPAPSTTPAVKPVVASRPTTASTARKQPFAQSVKPRASGPRIAAAPGRLGDTRVAKVTSRSTAVAPAPGARPELPFSLPLLSGIVLLLVGLGGAGVVAELRSRRRKLASLALEAELQEMIAEARAAQAEGRRERQRA